MAIVHLLVVAVIAQVWEVVPVRVRPLASRVQQGLIALEPVSRARHFRHASEDASEGVILPAMMDVLIVII